MGWTKQDLVEAAYGELALHSFVVTLNPDVLEHGLRRLDAMMAMWNGKGIRLGYPLPSTHDASTLDDDSSLPDAAFEPVFMNLAKRLASGHGKQVAPQTLIAAKEGYDMLMARAAMPSEVQYPGALPRGAGNKPWNSGRPFMPPPVDPLLAGGDGPIEFD